MFTIAVGDVHGCYDQLMELMKDIEQWEPEQEKKYVFLGDYVDRGPKSRQVIEYLIEHPEYICLVGNHEDMMLHDQGNWIHNGGLETIHSYNDKEIPKEHLEWLKNLLEHYEDEYHIFVHAGLMPEVPLSKQNRFTKIWIRDQFLKSNYDFGKLVVHGHTPNVNVEIKTYRINLDSACVFGGKLSAIAFSDTNGEPVKLFQVLGPQRE